MRTPIKILHNSTIRFKQLNCNFMLHRNSEKGNNTVMCLGCLSLIVFSYANRNGNHCLSYGVGIARKFQELMLQNFITDKCCCRLRQHFL